MMLRQKGGNAQADIAGTGHGDFDVFEISHMNVLDLVFSIQIRLLTRTLSSARK